MDPSTTRPTNRLAWILVVVLALIIVGGLLYYFLVIRKQGSTTPTPTPTASTKTSPTSSPTVSPTQTTSSSLIYTNSTYGFTLTFPATWKGYKMKEKQFTDSVITYYVTVPTTDASQVASDESDAGYFAPFAITVYTLAQWDTLQAQEGPKDTLIVKSATYAFGWSQANGIPATDFGNKSDDIATIIASFKLK